jgi:riboflavin synthase
MFTGLIEEIGTVRSANRSGGNLVLEIEALKLTLQIAVGDSVNIQGACQTVVAYENDRFTVNTISESLSKTNLGRLTAGQKVNLELAMRPDSRLGGHIVSGHIDCLGQVKSIRQIEGSWEVDVAYPGEFSHLVVNKGSVAVNGVSLTVTHASQGLLGVSLIPHSWEMTTFKYLSEGDPVNLEFDLIGKYVQKMIDPYISKQDKVTLEKFRQAGF